jgi:hypothetical protein
MIVLPTDICAVHIDRNVEHRLKCYREFRFQLLKIRYELLR